MGTTQVNERTRRSILGATVYEVQSWASAYQAPMLLAVVCPFAAIRVDADSCALLMQCQCNEINEETAQ